MSDFLEKFDDEHLDYFYAVSVLDGEGEDDRRTARICRTVNLNAMNAVRMSKHMVEDHFYRDEDDFMPPHSRTDKRRFQTWDEMRSNLGFTK